MDTTWKKKIIYEKVTYQSFIIGLFHKTLLLLLPLQANILYKIFIRKEKVSRRDSERTWMNRKKRGGLGERAIENMCISAISIHKSVSETRTKIYIYIVINDTTRDNKNINEEESIFFPSIFLFIVRKISFEIQDDVYTCGERWKNQWEKFIFTQRKIFFSSLLSFTQFFWPLSCGNSGEEGTENSFSLNIHTLFSCFE